MKGDPETSWRSVDFPQSRSSYHYRELGELQKHCSSPANTELFCWDPKAHYCVSNFMEVGTITCDRNLLFTKFFDKNILHCSACCYFPKCPNYANDFAHHMGIAVWLELSRPSGSPWTHPQRQYCVYDVFALTCPWYEKFLFFLQLGKHDISLDLERQAGS